MNPYNHSHASAIRPLAEALDNIAKPVVCRSGKNLFRQGDPGAGVFVLRRGKAGLHACSLHDTTSLPYRTVGPGYVLGLPALFSGRPYSLTAEALEDCTFGFVERERALQLVRERSDLCLQGASLLASELSELREWYAVIAEQSEATRDRKVTGVRAKGKLVGKPVTKKPRKQRKEQRATLPLERGLARRRTGHGNGRS